MEILRDFSILASHKPEDVTKSTQSPAYKSVNQKKLIKISGVSLYSTNNTLVQIKYIYWIFFQNIVEFLTGVQVMEHLKK